VRVDELDYEEVIDGDRYLFEASRRRADRSVVRLAVRRELALCGIFIPLPLGDDHASAFEEVSSTARKLLSPDGLQPVDVGKAQIRLDLRQLKQGATFRAARSRVTGHGSYVEFGSTRADASYADVDAVRDVRRAVGNQLTGDSAGLAFEITPERGQRPI